DASASMNDPCGPRLATSKIDLVNATLHEGIKAMVLRSMRESVGELVFYAHYWNISVSALCSKWQFANTLLEIT
ncbi:MAG TPA: hypothetical protein VHZ51_16055, partial [Ktedonobacteraceae bacterium]|nr:hypothetical protein [Ktedonobacteraceae bacterium]